MADLADSAGVAASVYRMRGVVMGVPGAAISVLRVLKRHW